MTSGLGRISPLRESRTTAAPDLTVAAVVERDDRFLVVEEWSRGHRVLNQPAGHVEPGESLLDAIVRETLEESRWDFAPEAVTGIYLWQGFGTPRPCLRVTFSGRCTSHHDQRPLDKGILGTLWMTRNELAAHAGALRSPMVLQSIDDYRAGRRRSWAELDGLDLAGIAALARPL